MNNRYQSDHAVNATAVRIPHYCAVALDAPLLSPTTDIMISATRWLIACDQGPPGCSRH
ncbi:hypothetical protein [Serratia microhaemolytica]|uniref:hypothetical protein n=1 Tax=Serratia microhaemolytica TaxID=2675110 RepID=UPI0012D83F19|nr:hypothetical protein [Serratia microhaemolytica]